MFLKAIDEHNRIIRTYVKHGNVDNSQHRLNVSNDENYAEIKAILLALGMEQDFIDNLSYEALESYSISTQLVGIVSYTKTDSNNNITYLNESVAIREASNLQEAQERKIDAIWKEQSMEPQPREQITVEDSYMRIFYLVTYQGSGQYYFSTDARWLTMPSVRGKDSIGSCAQNTTVTNSTRSGWYEYDVTTVDLTSMTEEHHRTNMSSTSFKNAVNGNWYGSAGIINLPDNVFSESLSISYKNYKAHYEYKGYVNYPNQESWFNTVGSYDHATFSISFEPSVTISTSGSSASIGLSIIGVTDTRSGELEMHYIP